MSKSRLRTGKVHLLCGASLLATAFAFSATSATAADAKAPAETKVAQNEQTPPPAGTSSDKVEKVTVTGFRGALRSALEQKKNSNSQIDAIKAEDVAKFPDLNLSEAIQRIPGVSISRDAGEGRNITVRGLGPQFTRIRINGMEALSTAGGTDAAGGTNRGRGFDFNVFAADLFNSITVRKTASAEVEEGSLGATVDLRAARPFDYSNGPTAAATGQYGWNDLSESYDPRGAALVSYSDGQFGALFSIAYAERNLLEEGASTVRWQNGDNGTPATCPAGASCFGALDLSYVGTPTLAQINSAFHPRLPRYDIYQHEQERLGMTGSLQWRPAEGTLFSLDLMYSKLDSKRDEIFLEAPVFSTNGNAAIRAVDVVDAVIEGGSLVYGRFNDVDIRSEFRHDDLSTEFRQVTLEGEHWFSDALRFHGLAGWSESDHQNPVQTTLLFDSLDVDGYSYDYRPNDRLPVITYGSRDVTIPASWTLNQIRLRPQTALNTYSTFQGDFTYNTTDWLTLKAGADWKKYEFETTELRRNPLQFPFNVVPNCTSGTAAQVSTANGNAEGCLPGFTQTATTPISSYSRLITFSGSGLDVPPGNTGTWLIPDLEKAAALWDLYNTSVFPLSIGPALGNNTAITEEDTGGFVQADFAFDDAFVPIRGNVGLRVVETKQTATGYDFASTIAVQKTVERSYVDTLPSLNLVLAPDEDFLIRVGLAKVMTRPGLGSLNPGAAVSVSGGNRTVALGQPLLDPFRAKTADFALEWYFQPQGLLGVAFFYKDITKFSYTKREDIAFAGNPYGIPNSVALAACGGLDGCTVNAIWQFSIPANTDGGPVKGFEINYQQPLTFLPAPLDNLGVLLNYTYVASEIEYLTSSGAVVTTADLLGLSRRAYNATLYYEDDVWSARISAAYRNDYLTTIPGRNGNTSESTEGTLNVDFAASYAVTDNLKVSLEGLNLTDEVNDQFLSPDDRTSFYHHFGRQYFLGFRYTY